MSRYVFGRYVEADLLEIRDLMDSSPSGAAIRFWRVGACLVLYLAERNPIEILAVVHGARDVPAIVNRRAH